MPRLSGCRRETARTECGSLTCPACLLQADASALHRPVRQPTKARTHTFDMCLCGPRELEMPRLSPHVRQLAEARTHTCDMCVCGTRELEMPCLSGFRRETARTECGSLKCPACPPDAELRLCTCATCTHAGTRAECGSLNAPPACPPDADSEAPCTCATDDGDRISVAGPREHPPPEEKRRARATESKTNAMNNGRANKKKAAKLRQEAENNRTRSGDAMEIRTALLCHLRPETDSRALRLQALCGSVVTQEASWSQPCHPTRSPTLPTHGQGTLADRERLRESPHSEQTTAAQPCGRKPSKPKVATCTRVLMMLPHQVCRGSTNDGCSSVRECCDMIGEQQRGATCASHDRPDGRLNGPCRRPCSSTWGHACPHAQAPADDAGSRDCGSHLLPTTASVRPSRGRRRRHRRHAEQQPQ